MQEPDILQNRSLINLINSIEILFMLQNYRSENADTVAELRGFHRGRKNANHFVLRQIQIIRDAAQLILIWKYLK